jgi:hypothetical protein
LSTNWIGGEGARSKKCERWGGRSAHPKGCGKSFALGGESGTLVTEVPPSVHREYTKQVMGQ